MRKHEGFPSSYPDPRSAPFLTRTARRTQPEFDSHHNVEIELLPQQSLDPSGFTEIIWCGPIVLSARRSKSLEWSPFGGHLVDRTKSTPASLLESRGCVGETSAKGSTRSWERC